MPVHSHFYRVFVSWTAIFVRVHHVGQEEGRTFLLYGIGKEPERLAYVRSG